MIDLFVLPERNEAWQAQNKVLLETRDMIRKNI